MTVACYLDPTRLKARVWMEDFAAGCDGHIVPDGKRLNTATDHVVMGHWPVAEKIIAECVADGSGYWFLDSSYIQDLKQRYLRIERNCFWPPVGVTHSMERAHSFGIELKPWRYEGRHVLICLHGMKFGRPWGIEIAKWQRETEAKVRAATDRPIIVRQKPATDVEKQRDPLEPHLEDAWCVVTHSSTAAVKAVLNGIPAFCAQTCAAAPVGCTDFSMIETPRRPDREEWIAALAWRQWSHEEMRTGKAWSYITSQH